MDEPSELVLGDNIGVEGGRPSMCSLVGHSKDSRVSVMRSHSSMLTEDACPENRRYEGKHRNQF